MNSLSFRNGSITLNPMEPLLFLNDLSIPKLIIENEVLVPCIVWLGDRKNPNASAFQLFPKS